MFAEERSQGRLELLLTPPARDWEVAAGKWLGAFTFYLLLLATTLVYVALLAVYVPGHLASLDPGLIGATYLGLVLVGAAATAIGLLASSLTQNRIAAFFLAFAMLLITWYASPLLGFLTQPPSSQVFQYAGAFNRFQSFGLGQVTLKDTVYFVSRASPLCFSRRRCGPRGAGDESPSSLRICPLAADCPGARHGGRVERSGVAEHAGLGSDPQRGQYAGAAVGPRRQTLGLGPAGDRPLPPRSRQRPN